METGSARHLKCFNFDLMKSFSDFFLSIIFFLSFQTVGQEIQSASFEYHHTALPSIIEYNEIYSISNSKITHFFIYNETGKNKKKRLKTSKKILEAVHFLDSMLNADYYLVKIDSIKIERLLKDTSWQKEYGLTDSELKTNFDSLNRICFEKKFFGRKIVIPALEEKGPFEKFRLLRYQLEPQVIDGTPFQLKFTLNSKIKIDYHSNLFAGPSRSNYAAWLSMYLMLEKYGLFDADSPISYYFNDRDAASMIRLYILWKKYGAE
jgi:hypothetical protein